MQHLKIKEAFIDILYDEIDGVQKTASGALPSTLPSYLHAWPRCYKRQGASNSYDECRTSFDELDDTRHVAYAATIFDGQDSLRIVPYIQPEQNEETHDDLLYYNRPKSSVLNLDYLKKLTPICKVQKREEPRPTTPPPPKTSNATIEALKTATQLCYDTVAQIEVYAVEQQLKSDKLWEEYNLRREEPPSANARNKRQKRSLAWSAATKLAKMMIGSKTSRKIGSHVLEYAGSKVFRNVEPTKRRGLRMLADLPAAASPLALLVGVTGLGYNMWQNYKTSQRLDKQLESIEENRKMLHQQAQNSRVIQLSVDRNTGNIATMNDTMTAIMIALARANDNIDVLTVSTGLHNAILQSIQGAASTALTCEAQLREITEILAQAQQGRTPNAFSTTVREEIRNYKLKGDQVMQHPDQPTYVSPIISGDKLDIYAQFVSGESEWELYEVIPLPRFAEGRAYTRRAAFRFALLDSAQRTYIQLDPQEAAECRRGACQATGVIRHTADDPCTIIMLALGKPREDCPMDESPQVPYFKATSDGLLFSTPEKIDARMHCRNADSPYSKTGVDKQITLEGTGLISMPAGCDFELTRPEVTIVGPPRHLESMHTGEKPKAISQDSSGIPHSDSNVALLRASSQLATKYKDFVAESLPKHASKLHIVASACIALGVLVAIICIVLTGKSMYIVRRFGSLTRQVTYVRDAFNTAFTSVITHARDIHTVLANRHTLRQYINGEMGALPVQDTIESADGEVQLAEETSRV
jgi:uncharacterized membrane protein YebE (DUF533 family)